MGATGEGLPGGAGIRGDREDARVGGTGSDPERHKEAKERMV